MIWASSPAGHLYGAMTLKQLRRQFGRRVPCLRIGDAPVLAHRGVQLCFPQGHTAYRPEYMQYLVPKLALWKINALYLYLESYFAFPSLPHMAGPGAMTPAHARTLDRLCREYNIQLIPMLNVLGHSGEILALQKYARLMEYDSSKDYRVLGGANLCATSPAVRRLVDGMLGDLMDSFSADVIHVGGDEVSHLGDCPRCAPKMAKLTKPQLYLQYFGRIKQLLTRHGRRMGIWGDMLLNHFEEAPPEERDRALGPLVKDTVIYDWHYDGPSRETLKFFTDAGFQTVACTSTNIYSCSSLWPAQAVNQRALFADAVAVNAWGGVTTGWQSYLGIHDEQTNYLHASGAALLWTGPDVKNQAPQPARDRFERAYSLQRYNLCSDALTAYWHVLGDAAGPVLSALAPYHGTTVRKCLYHTDNVLTFWKYYRQHLLSSRCLENYRRGLKLARRYWTQVESEMRRSDDLYWRLQAGPLLMHEHLLKRFKMSETLFRLYDAAARAQYVRPKGFAQYLKRAARLALNHLDDFEPVEKFLRDARNLWGLDQSSIQRVKATRHGLQELAAFLKYLAGADRPLPAFIQLHSILLDRPRSDYWLDREHEWAEYPSRFQRYSIERGVPIGTAINRMCESARAGELPDEAQRQKGVFGRGPTPEAVTPFVSLFRVSKRMRSAGKLRTLAYPKNKGDLGLTVRQFPDKFCDIHEDLFKGSDDTLVYFVCYLECREVMRLQIGLGYDGPVKLWTDGRERFRDPKGANPAWLDKSIIPWKASKGRHEIIIALGSNSGRAWGIFLRFRRVDVPSRLLKKGPGNYRMPASTC